MALNASGAPVLLGPNVARVEPNGLLVEGATTNLIVLSQAIGVSPGWGNGGITLNQPNTLDTLAPDGTQTASKFIFQATTAGQNAIIYEPLTLPATSVTYSIWLKSTGPAVVYVGYSNGSAGGYQTCNLTANWQRFTLTLTQLGASNFIIGSDQRGVGFMNNPNFPGATVYAWGAQAENLPWATSYFPTNTNVLPNSAAISATNWVYDSGSGGGGPVYNAAVAPDGTMTACQLTTSAGSGAGSHDRFYISAAYSTGVWTLSFYAKYTPGGAAYISLSDASGSYYKAFFNVAAQAPCIAIDGVTGLNLVSSSVIPVGNGWARYIATFNIPVSSNVYWLFTPGDQGANDPVSNYNNVGGKSVLLWGVQAEPGSYPSQFMYTGATITTTRAADIVSAATSTTWGNGPVSMYAQATPKTSWPNLTALVGGFGVTILDWAIGTNADRMTIEPQNSGAPATVYNDAAGGLSVGPANSPTDSLSHFFQLSYASPNINYAVDGVSVGSGVLTGVRTASASTIYLGNNNVFNTPFYGWLSNIKITTP
jgi:hypothetical protein